MGNVGIVNGQHLQHTLAGLVGPVNHQLQVAEVAHAETSFTTQRENGDNGASTLPGVNGEPGLRQFIDHHLARCYFGQLDAAVLARFPNRCEVLFAINHDELKLKTAGQQRGIKADGPLVALVLRHLYGTLGVPAAYAVRLTHNGQALVGTQLRGTHLQTYGMGKLGGRAQVALTSPNAVGKGRAVHKGVLGNINPMVIDRIAGTLYCSKLQAVGLHEPLVAHFIFATHHTIVIINKRSGLNRHVHVERPMQAVERNHVMLISFTVLTIRENVQHQVFTKNGLVGKVKL